jgi:nitrate/TMAO reductase-like tetraheme cytochrome c subunit
MPAPETSRFASCAAGFLVLCLFSPCFAQPVTGILPDDELRAIPSGDDAHGRFSYDDFQRAQQCTGCHLDIAGQWRRSLMSQAYTHHWDEIEYFRLAVPHAERKEKVAEVKHGCNGCHAPVSFLAGDTPPPRPGEGSMADEAVTCDMCHQVVGFEGEVPFNYNYLVKPGRTKWGGREGMESPHHLTAKSEFIQSAEFCGTCHNEKSPYDVWVKSTQLEYAEGPYPEMGINCQDCHMPPGHGRLAIMGAEVVDDRRNHLFHGAHHQSKLAGVIEMVMWTEHPECLPGDPVTLKLALFNGKAGHKVPSGSAEERQLWVTVHAVDADGNRYHLPVEKKGFEGEDQTITSNELAYQDIGEPLDDPDFAGLPRDSTAYEGDRIFCLPYFDEQGRRTIMQWNTASLGTDYRIAPRETKTETYLFTVPQDVPYGELRFEAVLRYRKLVKSVGDFLDVPAEETEAVVVGKADTSVEVVNW